jgi:hypothetical protein
MVSHRRYHYQSNNRIAPIIALADEGWYITTRASVPYQNVATHGMMMLMMMMFISWYQLFVDRYLVVINRL